MSAPQTDPYDTSEVWLRFTDLWQSSQGVDCLQSVPSQAAVSETQQVLIAESCQLLRAALANDPAPALHAGTIDDIKFAMARHALLKKVPARKVFSVLDDLLCWFSKLPCLESPWEELWCLVAQALAALLTPMSYHANDVAMNIHQAWRELTLAFLDGPGECLESQSLMYVVHGCQVCLCSFLLVLQSTSFRIG